MRNIEETEMDLKGTKPFIDVTDAFAFKLVNLEYIEPGGKRLCDTAFVRVLISGGMMA